MKCPKCQAENQDGAVFCSLCLTSFEVDHKTDPSKFYLKSARFKKPNQSPLSRINKLAFVVLMALLVYGFFAKDNYRQVEDIHPDLYQQPVQTEITNQITRRFEKDGYAYQLTPIYDYELNAFIISTRDYRRFSLKRTDNLYPLDLCVLWGDNVKAKVYQSKALTFAQDRRQSSWRWSKDLDFNNNEVANVHLVVENDALQNQLDMLQVGDQIKLKGQLVNVKAKSIGKTGSYEPSDVQLNSSTTREDSGPGACEIISVKSIEVLRKAHFSANSLFTFSYFSLVLLSLGNIAMFFLTTFRG